MPSGRTDDHTIDDASSQYPAHERRRNKQKPSSRAGINCSLPCSAARLRNRLDPMIAAVASEADRNSRRVVMANLA
jgi:hypothetical protein